MKKPHVIVLGGGFGGLVLCKALRHAEVEITLVDRQNHHLFQPLLYQVATAGLSAPEIAQPLRAILGQQRNLRVIMDEVVSIDLAGQKVIARAHTLDFDYLVIALGAVTGYFGHNEWAEHAPGLKSLDDATRIRRKLLLAFERAENSNDSAEIERLTSIAVVGGGPTGVEMAGACAELARKVLPGGFRRIDPAAARIYLVEAAPGILNTFSADLSNYARERLEKMGVTVVSGVPVKEVASGRLVLADREIHAETILWAAGVEANPLTRALGIELARGGRIPVGTDLALAEHPTVFAIGDIASCTDANGVLVPGVAPAAMQMAKHVAGTIQDELRAGGPCPRLAFRYWDKGNMATIGRSAAVAEAGGVEMRGFVAWLAWLFIHLVLLVGLRNRIAVFIQWTYSYLTYRRGARIITGVEDRPKPSE
jgi:NADH dehydrogenase